MFVYQIYLDLIGNNFRESYEGGMERMVGLNSYSYSRHRITAQFVRRWSSGDTSPNKKKILERD
jgi:hypothetical protein